MQSNMLLQAAREEREAEVETAAATASTVGHTSPGTAETRVDEIASASCTEAGGAAGVLV
jgi:hypothetical protein